MTPEKALELVGRYARLTRQIKDCGVRISGALDRCPGLSGKRGDTFVDRSSMFDSKGLDKDLHLWHWYQPENDGDYYGGPRLVWQDVGVLEEEECRHCYAAHLAVQERKLDRRNLGAVRCAMSRAAA